MTGTMAVMAVIALLIYLPYAFHRARQITGLGGAYD